MEDSQEVSRTEPSNWSFDDISGSFALASVVTEFAEIMRESYWAKGADLNDTLQKAKQLRNESEDNDDINELIGLIERATNLVEVESAGKNTLEPANIQYED